MAPDADALLAGLDPAQRHAVSTPSQPLCILAPAGSGKTRVLTRRIAYRAVTGTADPRHVLALTFTRKAARELTNRLGALGLRDLPTSGTFHSLAYAQLRTWWRDSGRTAPPLLDRKTRLLTTILGRGGALSARDLAGEIEWARARLVAPDRYAAAARAEGRRTHAAPDLIAARYADYEDLKRKRGVVDFDDLLEQCGDVLLGEPAFAAAQRWRFRHLFVDEFQDVNPLQHRLLEAWRGDRLDLCVVGDPNQAIYRWNGADASYLLRFRERHPEAEVVQLTESYRTTPEILTVARAVLGEVAGSSTVRANRPSGTVPDVVAYPTDGDEARGIARAVRDHHRPGGRWRDQAVLVRTNAQTALIEQALRQARVPYRVRGATPFLARPVVQGALRDLGKPGDRARPALAALGGRLDDEREATDPAALTEADRDRLDELDALVRLGDEFCDMEADGTLAELRWWLSATLSGDDGDHGKDAVEIATFHAAKGLEWPVVHVAGLEDGLVPIAHARTPEARDEERRLLYVAVTRARDVLRCTWAEQRTFGDNEVRRNPSPYLEGLRSAAHDLRATTKDVLHDRGLARARAKLAVTHEPGTAAELLHHLTEWRAGVARSAGTAERVVMSDEALSDVAERRPTDLAELAAVPGVGAVRADEYGSDILAVVARHRAGTADAAPAGTP